jgi:hypothetical protein
MTAFAVHTLSIEIIRKKGALINVNNWYCVQGTINIELLRTWPQALFFMVFIWTMFKILIVWRTMKIERQEDARLEKAQIFVMQNSYTFLWFCVWLVQKFCA